MKSIESIVLLSDDALKICIGGAGQPDCVGQASLERRAEAARLGGGQPAFVDTIVDCMSPNAT